ncbi:diiron oxygenase [Luteolibacter arcticus]|uniref:Diiron oxygenase n=1 Tax=Luteolibacter arcticus TaxID=1581411 RepID=A0ABT3GFA2_9BACT|nr:diiron oxygenase [Luteolibacter arcticus]MCW1922300.1 diiron oxygenase [Luteolibacter arcticus]
MPAEAVMPRAEIDFSRPFFPAHLAALSFVPSWRLLEDRHRLRYSQLYALYLNEQTVFFEELLATNVLPALYQRPDRIGADLANDLRQFETEERRHSRWFRELNHRVDPQRFRLEEGSYVFVPMTARTKAVTAWFARHPFTFPCWIWLMLLQEERSIAVGRECLRQDIEPAFRELHRKHLADEIDHVRWDLKLVERIWRPLPLWKRRLQAKLFGFMMAEFFTSPKRAAKAVLQALINEHPELQSLGPQLHLELRALSHSRDYHASLYSRETTPRCFALFDELPEFRNVGRHLLAYERR